jgi:GH15 family glucan-1,4-alpha-glucosidase
VSRIEDYGLLSDLQSAALVSREGSVDWCCLPRFDSPACFAALLGDRNNGRWRIAPEQHAVCTERRYRPNTVVLEAVFETSEGSVRLIDFMPPRGEAPAIVRIVEGVEGQVTMRSELVFRFDYGHVVPWVRRLDRALVAIAGPDALCLRTPAELRGENLTTVSEFSVGPGNRIPFVLTWFPSHQDLPDEVDAEQALRDTEKYWREWAADFTYTGPYDTEILQSLLVLKAMTYAPTGGIVAAPTASLPESIGGGRNWDYRFCWLRDASLTLLAMLRAGYRAEAMAWRDWLLRAIAGQPEDVQIMYGVAGERRLDERELEWLPGYEGSRPVRVGNAASEQVQLDVYGEVMDAIFQARKHGVPPDDDAWAMLHETFDWLQDGWRGADAGIWEVRGPARHFTHSKVMAWVAFDRAVRTIEELGRTGPADRWRSIRDEIHREVLERAWSERRQSFAQSYGSDELDASVLLMPLVGFLPADDPRMVSTVGAIERELTREGFVLRYRPRGDGAVDGLVDEEGVFLACSFWLVNVLALQGRRDEATALFERLLALRNDLGLLSEEYDPAAKRMLGNFPQAFTHLELINAAFALGDTDGMRGDRHHSTIAAGMGE